MEIKRIPLGLIKSNCYFVSGATGALVIDPGFSSQQVVDLLKSAMDKERLILLTHGHFDHIGGAEELRRQTNTDIAIGKDDAVMLARNDYNLSTRFHAKYQPFSADRLLCDGEAFSVGDLLVQVIQSAGHTIGGVCYLVNGVLFSGDTLFMESVGRTDAPLGDAQTLVQSVKKLYSLPDSTVVYPGHGHSTTIGHEKEYNPYVRSDR